MVKRIGTAVVSCSLSFVLAGCVSMGRFEQKEQEAQNLGQSLQSLQQKYADLGKENGGLKAQVEKLTAEGMALAKDKADLTGERDALAKEKERLTTDNRDLEKVLKAKSDTLSKNIAELRAKIGDAQNESSRLQDTIALKEKENAKLREDIALLQKAKEEEVKKTSKTYEDLLDKMKGEIAKGEVTISELQGKLTVNMVDAVLFDSGKAEVKPEGLVVLQKVIDILKGVKDKAIRIEGHTDNVPISGALARRFPTNWELSAARAINVTRYLQQQGIDPAILAAVGYGEYKPVAGNDTDEGKAKNRRIEIILVPKE
jgi:chemotaxis protein MotB